jgi:hypothetical protein
VSWRWWAAVLGLVLVPAMPGCRCDAEAPRPMPPPLTYGGEGPRATVVFGGDTSFARGVEEAIRKHGGGDPAWALAKIRPVLANADLAFLNLECVFTKDRTKPLAKRWVIGAPPESLTALTTAGVDVVSLANNHSMDFGPAGLSSTLDALRTAGIQALGVVQAADDDPVPLVTRVGDTTLAWLAYNDVASGAASDALPRVRDFDVEQAKQDIRRATGAADQVIVSVHWGEEYSLLRKAAQQRDARALIEAGADLIIGHHPHVPQEVEEHRRGLIAYSLGNFLFDLRRPWKVPRTRRGFLLSVTFEGGERVGWELIPTSQDRRHRPRRDERIDVASWTVGPPKTPYDLSRELRSARVERIRGGAVEHCGRWAKRPPRRGDQYLQWLTGRWVCDQDKKRPHLSVGRTGERSASVLRRGVLAHPHKGGPLRITYPKVPFGGRLRGHAGLTDWGVRMAKRKPAPVEIRVGVGGGGPSATWVVPHRAGWHEIDLDTSALRGTSGEVVVEIRSDSGVERQFLYGLWVED